jgi:oligopeptide/dipeptide ABC transporter ATP-binding protein
MSLSNLIELHDVTKRFTSTATTRRGTFAALRRNAPAAQAAVHVVDGVSLAIAKGEVLGLVGESGCGKSTLGRMMAGILPPSGGEIRWRARDVMTLRGADAREYRLAVQMIFQDPMSSLNARLRVADIVGEAPRVHRIVARGELNDYVDEQLRRAGFDPLLKQRYPHQFSGGQRQRIGIARALAVRPQFLICDESVAALDVSIQAQVLNLFMQLRRELDLTYLFISHDLGVVEHLSDRVAIMYLGRVVELACTEDVYAHANHPYTRSLLAAVPRLEARKTTFAALGGELPSPLAPPSGCHFHPRCPHAHERCRVERPLLREVAPGHLSACHLNEGGG